MGQKQKNVASLAGKVPQPASLFTAPDASVDPLLASLFASSSGPVKVPKVSSSSELGIRTLGAENQSKARKNTGSVQLQTTASDEEEKSSDSEELEPEASILEEKVQPRKRRRIENSEDLESSYLRRLAREEAREVERWQTEREVENEANGELEQKLLDRSANDEDGHVSDVKDSPNIPHESITGGDDLSTRSKLARTVFLGNVSTSAIKSKSAKKALVTHLSSFLAEIPKQEPPQSLESLRFRSTAYVGGSGPKKAAFAKKDLMDETTTSTNAYAVYTTETAAREAVSKLNGTIVLDRHLRVDSAAQSADIEHKRCIFVGNLSFVDKESVEDVGHGNAAPPRRPRAKEPADAEEGLWRTFGKVGKVESVRVIRDKETRVGKGFAYVQFKDENSVEAALLLNEKKFPPMLPRKLRVMRARRTKQKKPGTNFEANHSTRGKNGFRGNDLDMSMRSRSSSVRQGKRVSGFGRSKDFVFEGHRASSSATNKSGSKIKKRYGKKPDTRSSRRGAAFKAAGGELKAKD